MNIKNLEKKAKQKIKNLDESYVVQTANNEIKSFSVNEKALNAHKDLFKGYVDALNLISAKLDSVDRSNSDSKSSEFRSLKLDEVFNANASFFHSMYFDNIGMPDSSIPVDSITYMRLVRDWGTFDKWQEDFIACAMASRSGWVMTVYNIFLQRYINLMVDSQNQNIMIGCIPVILLDVHEHSYFKDYLNDKKSFIYNSMKEFNWDIIEKRFKRSDQLSKIYGVNK
jgi:Fe-Mn family superoxide dismutase